MVVAAAAPAAPQPRNFWGMKRASSSTLDNVISPSAVSGVFVSRAPRKAPCMHSIPSTPGAASARNMR
eukprot:scaffold170635_cov28-Tisochrysis_lutea.AAC.2